MNGLVRDKPLQDTDYLQILNGIPLDHVKILDSLLEFYKDPQTVIDHVWKAHEAYLGKLMDTRRKLFAGQRSEWKKYSENYYVNDACFLGGMEMLGFVVSNDIIHLSGPYKIFGLVGTFEKSLSEFSRDYYHHYFKTVLKAFKSNFILYAPEWYGISDGDTETQSISDLLALEDWRKVSSQGIHTMDHVYFEEL